MCTTTGHAGKCGLGGFSIAFADAMNRRESESHFRAPAFAPFGAPMNHKFVRGLDVRGHRDRLARPDGIVYGYRFVVDAKYDLAREVARLEGTLRC